MRPISIIKGIITIRRRILVFFSCFVIRVEIHTSMWNGFVLRNGRCFVVAIILSNFTPFNQKSGGHIFDFVIVVFLLLSLNYKSIWCILNFFFHSAIHSFIHLFTFCFIYHNVGRFSASIVFLYHFEVVVISRSKCCITANLHVKKHRWIWWCVSVSLYMF